MIFRKSELSENATPKNKKKKTAETVRNATFLRHFLTIEFSPVDGVEKVEVMKHHRLLQKQLQAAQQAQRKRRVDHRKRVQWF